jgi:N utilization substance protein B
MNPGLRGEQSLAIFSENFPIAEDDRPFFSHLVRGVCDHLIEIDRIIRRHSENWRLERMSRVDRNILRLAVFEISYCPDIPPRVAINEAIELGKYFGSEESGAFINGILDSIYLEKTQTSPKEESESSDQ